MRRSFLGGAVVLAAVISAGCASSDPQPERPPRATPSTGADAPAPVVLVAGMDTPGAGDARISGPLVESSGCLAVWVRGSVAGAVVCLAEDSAGLDVALFEAQR